MSLDFSRCRLTPFKHQREDVEWLIERPHALIASEMRTGKTKIVIDTAQFLFETGVINRVAVITPAPVRDVWSDPTLGELSKHLWQGIRCQVTEFHSKIRTWTHDPEGHGPLEWYITNFEFLRSKERLKQFMAIAGPKTWLIGDESSYLKNPAAQQTKAFLQLRRACGRVVLLNGTPIYHSPLDLFSQGNILHPSVLQCPYITHFKARYAIQESVITQGGKPLKKTVIGRNGKRFEVEIQKISGWTNLEDLQRRFAPITVRRLQAECLDLPPKLDPVMLTATLTPETWRAYKDMRDEMVVWLNESTVATSATAAVKALRLSQITSGFLGGVENAGIAPVDDNLLESLNLGGQTSLSVSELSSSMNEPTSSVSEPTFDRMPFDVTTGDPPEDYQISSIQPLPLADVGREKLDVLLWFIEQRLEADPNLHLVAWCKFRAEAFRTQAAVAEKFPQFETAMIVGGQKRVERHRALSLLHPATSPNGPVFVIGIEGTGSFGLNMTAAHTCVTLSSGYSPGRSAQTLDRVYGPGQKHPISYHSILAVGPKGQRTIDHQIEIARRAGQDVATWTSGAWVKALMEE